MSVATRRSTISVRATVDALLLANYRPAAGVGNLRKCGIRKVICGTKSAEVGCGTVGNMRNAE